MSDTATLSPHHRTLSYTPYNARSLRNTLAFLLQHKHAQSLSTLPDTLSHTPYNT